MSWMPGLVCWFLSLTAMDHKLGVDIYGGSPSLTPGSAARAAEGRVMPGLSQRDALSQSTVITDGNMNFDIRICWLRT